MFIFTAFLIIFAPVITFIMAHYLYLFLTAFLLVSCGGSTPTAPAKTSVATRQMPTFLADSAYDAIVTQLDFGPRVPGSEAQEKCAQWLNAELTRHGAKIYEMRSTVKAYDGTILPCINLVGSFNQEAKNRVLLMAHWDSRHIADEDPDPNKRTMAVPAANDGASGVGILLEIARLASLQKPNMGIDIFLTDAEDYGAPDNWAGDRDEKYWALGTQQWCKTPHVSGYRAVYGILLDMVGAADATFYREYYSTRYASDVVDLVWQTAARLGYSNLFINREGAGITDDHTFVNRQMHIPTIDIIDTRLDGDGTFYPHWHTTEDTLDKISKETLQKVGNVLVQLLW